MAGKVGVKFKFKRSQYTPKSTLSIKEMRTEYGRLSRLANKRIEALGRSEFAAGKVYQRYKEGFDKLKNISNDAIRFELSEVARFLENKVNSVSGQKEIKKKAIERLHDRGFKFVNSKNYLQFTEWMDALVDKYKAIGYDSDQVLEMFGLADEIGVDPNEVKKNLDFFLKNKEKVKEIYKEEMMKKKKKEKHTAKEFKDAVRTRKEKLISKQAKKRR